MNYLFVLCLYFLISALDSTSCFSCSSSAFIFFLTWISIVFICFYLFLFFNALPRGEYKNLAFYIILLWSENNVSSPVVYSFLSISHDDNADIFATSLLMSKDSFSFLMVSSIVLISFNILSARFFLKRKDLSDVTMQWITKKEYVFLNLFVSQEFGRRFAENVFIWSNWFLASM